MAAAKGRILLVDDDSSILKVYRKRLEIAGYDVVTARDGEEALAKMRGARPDLVVLDIMLPKLNGYEVCTRLKQAPATKQIPIVMFTAKDRPQEHVAGLMVGADAYLSKTCEAETLLEQIERLLGGEAKEGEQAARGASSPAPGVLRASPDRTCGSRTPAPGSR